MCMTSAERVFRDLSAVTLVWSYIQRNWTSMLSGPTKTHRLKTEFMFLKASDPQRCIYSKTLLKNSAGEFRYS